MQERSVSVYTYISILIYIIISTKNDQYSNNSKEKTYKNIKKHNIKIKKKEIFYYFSILVRPRVVIFLL